MRTSVAHSLPLLLLLLFSTIIRSFKIPNNGTETSITDPLPAPDTEVVPPLVRMQTRFSKHTLSVRQVNSPLPTSSAEIKTPYMMEIEPFAEVHKPSKIKKPFAELSPFTESKTHLPDFNTSSTQSNRLLRIAGTRIKLPQHLREKRLRSSQKELLEGLLKGYDVNEWPHFYYGKRTDVHVQMFINSFGSLNAANMDFRIDLFLRQTWQDPRLAYSDKRPYLTVLDSEMQNKIWRPDTYFDNVKEAKVHQVTLPNVMLRIGKMGDVLYSMRFTLLLSCYMNFVRYPFDTQHCEVVLAAFASMKNMVAFHWDDYQPIRIPEELEIAEFDLLQNRTAETTLEFSTGNFSGLLAQFTLRRQNGYHILQTYVPTILIVSISWVNFWLDPHAIPGRVTLGVTTLLTLTTLASGVRQSLPRVSYVKAIDVWVGMCMIMVFAAVIEFTISNWLANLKKVSSYSLAASLPACLQGSVSYMGPADDCDDWGGIGVCGSKAKIPGGVSVPKPPATYIKEARNLDRFSRAMFPAVFLLFNIFYWPYYILMQYGEATRPQFAEI